ncbi:MAG TPA: hypothetical protein VFA04_13690 [Bryobacteraceae bacterium]|nr:hypothetical protein [Bryobacteraceae bacterium]
MRTLLVALLVCIGACAQTTAAAYSQNATAAAGVMSQWDVQTLLTHLEVQTKQLGPAIDRMRPDMWATNGAPQTYAVQWKSAKNEAQYLVGSAQALTKEPERLTLALDTLFRMQALDRTLGSLVEAVRKYQNPQLADTLAAGIGETSINRDKLRQYVVELAAQKEHEYQVMDSEAQRCRGALAGAKTGTAQRRRNSSPSRQTSEQK